MGKKEERNRGVIYAVVNPDTADRLDKYLAKNPGEKKWVVVDESLTAYLDKKERK